MHPRISELLDYIELQTAELRAAYAVVPPDRRAMRPAPDRWSPAEVIPHLVIVDRRLAQRLAAMIEQARALPPESETTPILPLTRADIVVDRSRRLSTSEIGQPRDTDPTCVWDDFDETRAALEKVIISGDGLALGSVSAPHPALGSFTAYDWIAFVGAHAARHAAQIREMTNE